MLKTNCVFCEIIRGELPCTLIHEWDSCIAIIPTKPVTPGHVLVIPKIHVKDFTESPLISAETMRCVAELAVAPCNVISSAGIAATQSVFHLHMHIVPRMNNDDLLLPWSIR